MPGGRDGGGSEEADAVLAEKGFGPGGEMPDTGVRVAEAVEDPGSMVLPAVCSGGIGMSW